MAQSLLTLFIMKPLLYFSSTLYVIFQNFIAWIFGPSQLPSKPFDKELPKRRIAIIGAGLTGVSSAAHCISHGFEVQIFEARGKEKGLGGIWSRVNSTSALQINSIMYRFHPTVRYKHAYSTQHEIRDQIVDLWKRYGLEELTEFGTPISSIQKAKSSGKWVINDHPDKYGSFDGVITAVGVCGDPKMPSLPDQNEFKGNIWHSSDLDGKDIRGKTALIIGGGASAIEALEFAVQSGASEIDVLSRSDKWIIPRNIVVQSLLACNIWGEETSLAWLPEWLLHKFFYRDLQDIAPESGLFTTTPMANSDLFNLIREGKAQVPKGGSGREKVLPGDIIIMATGFKRPSLSFLPNDAFEQDYSPPDWYLQVFPPKHLSICANNSTYVNAIGTVGNAHIGIYTRFLLMFLTDPLTQPTEGRMKTWINFTRWMKQGAPPGAFDFFTYTELLYWFVFLVLINPFRWKWALFILFGVEQTLPLKIVREEGTFRRKLESQRHY
ncbi:Pyridine nucleotide-disulfide oxidoreductase, class-II [Penicillium italicum]|uniref:Pyridine nucleotide-disulfide oxidoreductase, class-II n=1 Tax=Penicillium italicum TaxID=40296 RepID=A0A0A2KQW8_PENIT|nr:Pyridine nucleotide-disulfide oxidoreductase, class-II [Penicillium italicum]